MLPKLKSFKDRILRRRNRNRVLPDIHDKDFISSEFGEYRKFDVDDHKYKSFCMYFVDLAGKLIISDGVPLKTELSALNQIFHVSDTDQNKILLLLKESYEADQPLEIIVKQMDKFFGNNRLLYKKTILYLMQIALADAPLNKKEVEWFKDLCDKLQLEIDVIYSALRAILIPASRDPYLFLNLSRDVTIASLNKEYRQLASSCHPDKFVAYEYSEEFKLIISEKFNLINNAYNLIKSEIK
jgi:DnaJ-domain-containing protein 1